VDKTVQGVTYPHHRPIAYGFLQHQDSASTPPESLLAYPASVVPAWRVGGSAGEGLGGSTHKEVASRTGEGVGGSTGTGANGSSGQERETQRGR